MNSIPHRFSRAALAAALCLVAVFSTATPAFAIPSYSRVKLFDGVTGGGAGTYHSYRIPSIVRTKNGHLIAVCEARKSSAADFGQNIDIVIKRATYNSTTLAYNAWSSQSVLLGAESPDQWTWGNPTMVVDTSQGANGRVWLFVNRQLQTYTTAGSIPVGQRYTFTYYSDNEGVSWTGLTDRTTELGGNVIQFDYVGPGVGIQKTQTEVGQLVVPARGRNFFSNNHGTNWSVCAVPNVPITPTESTIVERSDGILIRNDRILHDEWEAAVTPSRKRRYQSLGTNEDGFANYVRMDLLLDPNCEGSILCYNQSSPHRIIFLNSASTDTRTKMMVRISYDNGASYADDGRFLYIGTAPDNFADHEAVKTAGKGGYSSMAKTADFHVGALVEINEPGTGNRSIEYHRFNLDWITEPLP